MQQKRKVQDQENAATQTKHKANSSKKKQRLIDQRQKKKSKKQFEGWRALSATVAHLPPSQQADWLFQSYAELTKASALERGPLVASTLLELPHPDQPLQARLQQLIPDWKTALCDAPHITNAPIGAPRMLIVCASAVAANEVAKLLPAFNARQRIGKLFAKHFKQSEQEAWLRSNMVSVASGTPHRLAALAESGALSLARLEYVLVDVGLDAKQRTILDQPETCRDFWGLYDRVLKDVLRGGEGCVGDEGRGGAVLVLFGSSTGGGDGE